MLKLLLTIFFSIFLIIACSEPKLFNNSNNAGKTYLEGQIRKEVSNPNFANQQELPLEWSQLKNGGSKISFTCGSKIIELEFTATEMIAASHEQITTETKSKINNVCNPPGSGGPPQ
jgi:hypothetical protein